MELNLVGGRFALRQNPERTALPLNFHCEGKIFPVRLHVLQRVFGLTVGAKQCAGDLGPIRLESDHHVVTITRLSNPFAGKVKSKLQRCEDQNYKSVSTKTG